MAQVLEIERSALQPMLGPFDGFNESEHAVTGTCLISFDRNRYSVLSTVARRTVQVRAYADRIVVRCGEEVVAEHPRYFGRNRTIYDPWHYLPVLARKPGALRNGAPFQDWDLPPALARLRRKLGNGDLPVLSGWLASQSKGRSPVRPCTVGRTDRSPGACRSRCA
ncbi:hypothetical protein SPH9361_02947 [Sphingobium sp. CECT 9361]|nr:hypothetical protein SPH9361_02947 [Sphingobium sp. CECT 9361]